MGDILKRYRTTLIFPEFECKVRASIFYMQILREKSAFRKNDLFHKKQNDRLPFLVFIVSRLQRVDNQFPFIIMYIKINNVFKNTSNSPPYIYIAPHSKCL